jgi:cell division protein FtsB
MQDFRKRPNGRLSWSRMFLGCGAILALALLAFFSVRSAWGMYEKFTEAAAADEQAQNNLAQLQQQYTQVNTDVQEVSTPEGLDGQVRERWGLAKPGEGEIDIVEEPAASATTTPPSQSLWSWLMHAFSVL